MTPKVIIFRVPPAGARLQEEVVRKGPLWKAVCEDRSLPVRVQMCRLEAWAAENGVAQAWVHLSRDGVPHIDLWGAPARRLGLTPPSRDIRKALTVWQPWAWLIVEGFKPIENRPWPTSYRGPFFIHAGKRPDPQDADIRREVKREFGIEIPPSLPLGGIVGEARIVDCVTESESPWFSGPFGFVLADRRPLPFVPCPGRQKLWEVSTETLAAVRAGETRGGDR